MPAAGDVCSLRHTAAQSYRFTVSDRSGEETLPAVRAAGGGRPSRVAGRAPRSHHELNTHQQMESMRRKIERLAGARRRTDAADPTSTDTPHPTGPSSRGSGGDTQAAALPIACPCSPIPRAAVVDAVRLLDSPLYRKTLSNSKTNGRRSCRS